MARRAALSGFSLNLFGGGGVDSSVFNIASQSRQNEAYLALTRVEVQWEAGKVSDADYLAALDKYVKTFPENSSERLNQQSRLESTTYRIERNVLVSEVESGKKGWDALLAYDQTRLVGLNPSSQEYLSRQNTLFNTQNRLFSEEEKIAVERYSDGKMTTVQLQNWYAEQSRDPRFNGNVELATSINERVRDLADRVTDEVDSKTISDYSNGKIDPTAFLAYAQAARGRYAEGTPQASEWDDRIEQASDAAIEGDLNYRYGLSQDYLRLQEFVQSNSKPAGGTSTSTSKRTVLDANGNWKVVESTSTKAYAPSKSEVAAYKKRQIEVAAAKQQMAKIAAKLGGMRGGFIQTGEMISYYSGQLNNVARGSQEWYAIQGKIDTLNAQASAEKVLSRQGIKISYPKVRSERPETFALSSTESGVSAQSKAEPKLTDDTGHTLEDFKRAIAKIESGGRYTARNKSTGAYGKYQILPSNWANWAEKAGLPRNAPQTPENQEKVVAGRFEHLYKKYDGDFSRMAAEWFAGAAGSRGGPSAWGPRTRRYVEKAMSVMGKSYNPGRATGQGVTSYGSGGGGAPASNYAAKGPTTSKATPAKAASESKPHLHQVIGEVSDREELERRRRTGDPNDTGVTGVKTQAVALKGMDARQFRKVYDAIETAWQNGYTTAFVDLGDGNRMTVFLGDDPDERQQIMSELDNQRISLADVELQAYRGTGSESTKSQSALAARKDSIRHSLISLSTEGYGTDNVVAQAVNIGKRLTESIKQEIDLGQKAWDQGDQTAAYRHWQTATVLANDDAAEAVGEMRRYLELSAVARGTLDSAEAATGLSIEQLVSGGGKGATAVKDDLAALEPEAFRSILDKVVAPAEKSIALLDNYVKKDQNGNVVIKNGEVQFNDNVVRMVNQTTGKIDYVVNPNKKPDLATGKMVPDTGEDLVPVILRNGTTIVDAYAKFKKQVVGSIQMPDGSKIELFGRAVNVPQDRNGDGIPEGSVTYVENPMKPGSWSSTAIKIIAPKGSTSGYFSYGSKKYLTVRMPGANGETLMVSPDETTGQYQLWKQTQAGFGVAASANEPVLVGAAAQSLEASQVFAQFSRDKTGMAESDRLMSDLPGAVVNISPDEWAKLTRAPRDYVPTGRVSQASRETSRKTQQIERYERQMDARSEAFQQQKPPRAVPKPGSPQAGALDLLWGGQAPKGAPYPTAPVSQPSTPPKLTPLPSPARGTDAAMEREKQAAVRTAPMTDAKQERAASGPTVNAATGFTTPKPAAKPAAKPKRTTTAKKKNKLTPLPTRAKKEPAPYYSGPLGR